MYNSASIFQRPTTVAPSTSLKGSACKGGTGKLYGNGSCAWVTDGKRVEIFNVESGQFVSGWSHQNATITCIAEMRISPRKSLLLLGLVAYSKHVLAVFDPTISVVKRALLIPAPIVTIHAISPTNLEMPGLFASTFLKHFSGVSAVGCRGGHTYIVDLCLSSGSSLKESVSYPHPIHVVGWQEVSAGTKLASAIHGSLELTAGCHQGDTFMYHKDDTVITFPAGAVAVTALYFAPQICSLLVGYSFGCFQVFSLSSLALSFSSSYKATSSDISPPPVTHFAYQEPEDDPKHFVYMWAARGPCAFTGSSSFHISITLYRLVYDSRIRTSMPLGYCYENLKEVMPLLEHRLSSLPSVVTRTVGDSCLLHCSTLERRHNSHGRDELHDESIGPSTDLTLVSFVWRSSEGADTHYYLGVFDINQWYHAQMPQMVKWRHFGKHSGVLGCSYFAFYLLDSALSGNTLQDALVSRATNFSFLPPVPETHMWPTSLSFDFSCLVGSSNIVKCKFMGLQRTVLYELKRLGAAAFTEPQRLFSLCEAAELLSAAMEHSHEQRDCAFQMKALLCVCLENDLISTLLHCAQTWNLTESGCILLRWIEQTLSDVLEENARLCSSVFEEGSQPVELSLMSRGQHLLVNVRHLTTLIQTIVKILKDGGHEQLYSDLMAHYHSCVINTQLMDIVLWFTSSHLLPCTSDPATSAHTSFYYPADALQRRYRQYRNNCPRLAIDYLTEELRGDQDQEAFKYPPPSLKDLVSIFSGLNTLAQHCVIMYFLHDVREIRDSFQQLVTSYVKTFAVCKHLAAFVEVLWQMDHDFSEVPLHAMMSRSLPKEWFPWQHELLVGSLVRSGHTRQAIQYMCHYDTLMAGLEGTKLKVMVLVAHGSIGGAIEVVRSVGEWQEELIALLLDQCYSTKQLHTVIDLPLQSYQSLVCSYLENHPSIVAKELLVTFYLKHSQYIDALQVYEKLKSSAWADPDPETRNRVACLGAILSGFSKALPQALQGIAAQAVLSNPPQVQRVKADKPLEPLTRLVAKEKCGGPPLSTRAGLLVAVMEKVAEARVEPSQPFTPLKKSPTAHVPFLSTPISVKRVHSQLQLQLNTTTPYTTTATPKTKSSVVPTSISNTSTADTIAKFMQHLLEFRSSISTPEQQPESLEVSHLKSSVMTPRPQFCLSPGVAARNTPHSILKVRHLSPEVEEDAAPAPASPDGTQDIAMVTKNQSVTMATKDQSSRKIRFAVEGHLLQSPSPDHPAIRSVVNLPPIPFPSSSTLLHMAQSTPLPGDASDEFVTPVESPSHLDQPPEQQQQAIPLIWDSHVTGSGKCPAEEDLPSHAGRMDEGEAGDEVHPGEPMVENDGLEMGEEVEVGVEQDLGKEVEMNQEQETEQVEVQEGVEQVEEEVMVVKEGEEQVEEEIEVEQLQEEIEVEQEQRGVEQVKAEVQPVKLRRKKEEPLEMLKAQEGMSQKAESLQVEVSEQLLEEEEQPVATQQVRKTEQSTYHSLPTLRRTIFTRTTAPPSLQTAADLIKHTTPRSLSIQTPQMTSLAQPTTSMTSLAQPTTSMTSLAQPTTSMTSLAQPTSMTSQAQPTSKVAPSTSSQASSTPASRDQTKPSIFVPLMESDIRSIKKSQRKKTGRLRIKRLSELKPKKASQHVPAAEQQEATQASQPAKSDVDPQQSYSFSSPATIAVSSKPIQGSRETRQSSHPTKEFVFSPPMTRARLRRLQDDGNSRDTSFVSQTTPTIPVSSRVETRELPQTPHVQSSKEQIFLITPPVQASTPTESSRKSKAKPLASARKRERLVTKK